MRSFVHRYGARVWASMQPEEDSGRFPREWPRSKQEPCRAEYQLCKTREVTIRFMRVGSLAASRLQCAIRCESPDEVGSDCPFDGGTRSGSARSYVDPPRFDRSASPIFTFPRGAGRAGCCRRRRCETPAPRPGGPPPGIERSGADDDSQRESAPSKRRIVSWSEIPEEPGFSLCHEACRPSYNPVGPGSWPNNLRNLFQSGIPMKPSPLRSQSGS